MKTLSAFFILLFACPAFAQEDTLKAVSEQQANAQENPYDRLSEPMHTSETKSSYLDFLFNGDTTVSAPLFYGRDQYLYVPSHHPFRHGGVSVLFGINLARFVSKKMIIGICFDFKLYSLIPQQNFTEEFRSDFNKGFNTTYANAVDSLRASILHDGINGENGVFLRGDQPGYIGISFSPFPKKWGGFLLEVKTGRATFNFYGQYDGKRLSENRENEPVSFKTGRNLLMELSFKPYKFFNSENTSLIGIRKPKDFLKFVVITVYYEKFTLDGALFGDRDLNSMVSQEFIDKYSNRDYWGIRFGFGAY